MRHNSKTAIVIALTASIIILVIVFYGEHLATLEEENIISQKESKVFPLVSKFETEIFDISSLLEITSKEKSVTGQDLDAEIVPSVHGVLESEEIAKRETARAVLFNKKILDAVFFALPNGDMYLVEPYQYQRDLVSTNFSFREWYQGVIDRKSTFVSGLFQAQGKVENTIAIATPVRSDSAEFLGIWGGLINLNSWNSQFAKIDLRQDENVRIIDHRGNVVIDAKGSATDSIVSYHHLESVNSALLKKSGHTIESLDGLRSLVVYAPITLADSNTWAIIITEPVSEAFEFPFLIRIFYTASAIAAAAIAAIVLFYPGSRVSPWPMIQKIRQLDEGPDFSRARSQKTATVAATCIVVLSVAFIAWSYIQTNQPQEEMKSSYLVQNLRGDTVETWINWRIPEGDLFHIHIVDSDEVTSPRIQAISEAVHSRETIQIDDSLVHKGPEGSTSTYYKGWLGALESISDRDQRFPIPAHFHSTVTVGGEGHILIKLSEMKSYDGYAAYTKSYVDESNHQILKSVITIYNVDELSYEQLTTIVRHELGHAFGLGHSTAPEDLMAPIISTEYPYISECMLEAVSELYNGKQQSQIVCEK